MIFESLWPLAFLLAVPIVIILYLLVPKGKDTKVSSNILWEKLFKNRQSKTFLEKFIHNLLMYLQIVILLLLILSLMSPYIRRQGNSGGNTVLVLDTSGSMQHKNSDGTMRIEQAVKEAKNYIEASEGAHFSIVTTDGCGTTPVSVNVSDKTELYRELKQISCTDPDGKLSDAVGTVETLCGDGEQKKASNVLVFTDGTGARYAEDFTKLLSAEIRVMGEPVSNVAGTFLSCAKEKDGYTAAAGLVNYSDHTAELELSLYEGDKLLAVRKLSLEAQENSTCLFEKIDWKGEPLRTEISSVHFADSTEGDSLDADNVCYALADTAEAVDAVLVGNGNTYIEKAYQAVTGQNLTKAKEESTLDVKKDTIRIYDADTAEKKNDTASHMVFSDKAGAGQQVKNVSLSVSDTKLTAGITNFAVGVNKTYVYDLPEWATGFLWNGEDCAGYYGEHDGIRQVVIGFDIRESDFALQPEFPVFMANALGFLGDSSLLAQNVYEAGEKVLFHPQNEVDTDTIEAPTEHAGIFTVEAGEIKEHYVVRFAASTQSDGRITAEQVSGTSSYQGQLVRKQLRNVLLILALILMILEWILYVRQQRKTKKFYFAVRVISLLLVVLAVLGVSVRKSGAANTTIFLVDISNSNEQNLEAMDDYLSEKISKMPDKNQYGIVTFGNNSLVEQFLTKERGFSGIMSVPDKTATNLEEAVSRGLSMIPEDTSGRLVILTDGKETKGDLESTASVLKSRQVELLSVVYETTQGKDAYMEQVEMPAYLYAGDAYSMTVTVVSNYDTDAAIEVIKGKSKKTKTKVHLNKGTNRFVLKQKVTADTAESLKVSVVAAGDTCEENNSYSAYAVINTVPRVLVISGMKEDSTQFSNLLKTAGCNYHVVSAINAPQSLEEMLAYKSIVLENVYRDDLPEGFLNSIDTYVKDYGCGLVCCGGEESYALGGYRDTELEKILPVDMEPRGMNEQPSLAMVMVIDRSGSMSDIADAAGGATNLDLAITAAKEAVDALRDKDYVGVLTFDDVYKWQLPITEAADKEHIHEVIETIPEGGGTTIKPALKEALKCIQESDASMKHVVLLTDGQGETSYFDDVIAAYQEEGVTLSTVAVGTGADTKLLERLAENCDGRYYYSDISTDIPKIFAQEVYLSGETYLQNGTFSLAANNSHAITKGLYEDGWPKILGYVSATPKASANVLIAESEKKNPILSVMQYGLGHTVAWNTDVTNRWSSSLAGYDDYVQLWKRIMDYSAGNTGPGEDSLDVTTVHGSTQILYRASDYAENTSVEAVYTDPEGNTKTQKLQATAPGVFETSLDTDITGIYNLSVRRMNGEETENAITTAAVVQYSDEYKFALTGEKFCAFVKKYGKLIRPDDNFWKNRKTSSRGKYNLTRLLLILAIIWFVMDIAMRRFCFVPQDTRLYQYFRGRFTNRRKKHIMAEEKAEPEEKKVQKEQAPAKEKKRRDTQKKKEQPTLDTSALLNKKNQRNQ